MNSNRIQFLRRQILEMDRLAETAKDDILSSFAIEKRRAWLEKQLNELLQEQSAQAPGDGATA